MVHPKTSGRNANSKRWPSCAKISLRCSNRYSFTLISRQACWKMRKIARRSPKRTTLLPMIMRHSMTLWPECWSSRMVRAFSSPCTTWRQNWISQSRFSASLRKRHRIKVAPCENTCASPPLPLRFSKHPLGLRKLLIQRRFRLTPSATATQATRL